MDKLVESLPADLLAYELEHRLRNGFGPEGDEQDDSEERKEGKRIFDADGGLDQLTHNDFSRPAPRESRRTKFPMVGLRQIILQANP